MHHIKLGFCNKKNLAEIIVGPYGSKFRKFGDGATRTISCGCAK